MPTDVNGRPVSVGTRVRVLRLAEYLERDLPHEDWSRVKTMVGEVFEVIEVDEWGVAWIEKWWRTEDGESFCHSLALDSHEMEVVSPP